jgi:hypothetical protein
VRWFRRSEETLNDKLLREAGYGPDGTALPDAPAEPAEARAPGGEGLLVGSLEQIRPRNWDIVTPVEAPALEGDAYEFATLPDGSLIVDESCKENLSSLADAVEEHLEPPYRAIAVRQTSRLWMVSARNIEIAQLATIGDEATLSSVDREQTFSIDGQPADATLAPDGLARFGEALDGDYAVHATRLDGDLWEIDADPL